MSGLRMTRHPRMIVLIAACGLLISACAAPPGATDPPPLGRLQPGSNSGQMTAVLPSTDLSVGTNQRFLVGIIGTDNRPVSDASVELLFFKVTGPSEAQLRSRASTDYHETPGLPGRGVYVARTDFDEPGDWGVAAEVSRPGQPPTELRVAFRVKERSSTPAVGETAPASRTPTAATQADAERFSSARPADPDLYRLSIADALREGKPLAVLFASPAFCTSQTCGPSLDVLADLKARYQAQANFIHVEIYKDGRPPEVVGTVGEWGLTSEPWLFVVGRDGRLWEKFEGSITPEESGAALAAAIVGQR